MTINFIQYVSSLYSDNGYNKLSNKAGHLTEIERGKIFGLNTLLTPFEI